MPIRAPGGTTGNLIATSPQLGRRANPQCAGYADSRSWRHHRQSHCDINPLVGVVWSAWGFGESTKRTRCCCHLYIGSGWLSDPGRLFGAGRLRLTLFGAARSISGRHAPFFVRAVRGTPNLRSVHPATVRIRRFCNLSDPPLGPPVISLRHQPQLGRQANPQCAGYGDSRCRLCVQ